MTSVGEAAPWLRIVRTQPAAVRSHLRAERELVADRPAGTTHGCVVEVGCADGTLLLPVVLALGLHYRGVDLEPGAVAATRRVLAECHDPAVTSSAQVAEGDVCELPRLVDRGRLTVGPDALVAFPFNVIGSVPRPEDAFVATAAVGADVLVLGYDTGPRSREVRTQYYAECGFDGEMTEDEVGVHFRSPELVSTAYHPPVLARRLDTCGYDVSIRRFGEIGVAYVGRLRQPDRPQQPARRA